MAAHGLPTHVSCPKGILRHYSRRSRLSPSAAAFAYCETRGARDRTRPYSARAASARASRSNRWRISGSPSRSSRMAVVQEQVHQASRGQTGTLHIHREAPSIPFAPLSSAPRSDARARGARRASCPTVRRASCPAGPRRESTAAARTGGVRPAPARMARTSPEKTESHAGLEHGEQPPEAGSGRDVPEPEREERLAAHVQQGAEALR